MSCASSAFYSSYFGSLSVLEFYSFESFPFYISESFVRSLTDYLISCLSKSSPWIGIFNLKNLTIATTRHKKEKINHTNSTSPELCKYSFSSYIKGIYFIENLKKII